MLMEYITQFIFILIIGAVVWLFHKQIAPYPEPRPMSENPHGELKSTLWLWLMALIITALRIFLTTPLLESMTGSRVFRELIQLPFLTVIYLAIPAIIVVKMNGWKAGDMGLNLSVKSKATAIGAVIFGLVTGLTAYLSRSTVMEVTIFPASVYLLLLYNNDFLEEFFHRGIILSKLETALGQTKAIFWGGILFGLTHIVFDIIMLGKKGIFFVIAAFLLQVLAGWLLGIIYMKTRSLWPGVTCHYLSNWLPAILFGTLG